METVSFKPSRDTQEAIDRLFEREKRKLLALVPNVEIEHIGSTAVPGSLTKGDLDINIRISQDNFEIVVQKLRNLYQINQLEQWTKTYASFKTVIDGTDFGAQVTVIGSKEDDFIAHRDFLKQHPEAVEEYNRLKRSFEGKDMAAYRAEKAKFFDRIRSEGK